MADRLVLLSLSRRPSQIATAQQVQMQMKHRLAGARADVVHRTISVLDAAIASDLGRDQMAVANYLGVFRIRRIKSRDVALGNNQHVGWRLGSDVLEGENSFVFVDFLRGNLAGDDFAEETVVHAQY